MNKAFTDADYERMVRERDEALARVDSQRSQIAFYRTACTARFLPEGFGDETMRELIKELAEERDEARAQVDELRGQYQYSVGLSMALEERDQARRERDEWRDKFLALNQTAGEICNACGWAFKIPGEECRCEVVKERDDCQKQLDEVTEELRALTVEHADESTLCDNALGHLERVTRERDEARANYQWMVNRACDEKLDGYRELGAKCAQLEEERDEAREAYREARASRWHVSKKWDEALKEIERLRTENEDMGRALNEVRAEVEHAYREGGALYEAKIAEREAFRSGAEAMREACANELNRILTRKKATAIWVGADEIRATPLPEEP